MVIRILKLVACIRSKHALFAKLLLFLLPSASAQPGTSVYTIPVVFHVLHENGPENIDELQIADAMTILNTHFDAPTWPVEPPYDAIAADMDIAFVLASVAPDGSPTNGIDRIETALTNQGGIPASYMNTWPRNQYLNIWTAKSLATPNISYTSLLPGLVDTEPCRDGVMIFHTYVGSIGAGSPTRIRTLTQAVGRFLNLKMVYEDPIGEGPCADDEVDDTPPAVPDVLCNGALNACADVVANEHNYMSSPYCSHMFTQGQRERVHACLNSPIAQRNELASGIITTTPDCSTTSVAGDGLTGPDITAFPIPFVDHISLIGLPQGQYSAELIDQTGRTVSFVPAIDPGIPWNLGSRITPGSYLLKLGGEQTVHLLRVVKE